MSGERDLRMLLTSLRAQRQPGTYVCAVAPAGFDLDGVRPAVTVAVRSAANLQPSAHGMTQEGAQCPAYPKS
jgi:hypothetical protein